MGVRIALVVNPKSGSAPDPEEAQAALEGHGAEVVELVKWPGQVEGGEAERLVAVSGDGLVATMAERAGELGIPLAVVPGGTANDFARSMGLPQDHGDALALAATGTQIRGMELAYLDDRPFVNVVGAGLAPEAGKAAAPHKDKLGPLAYPVGALIAGLASKPLGARVLVDGREVHAGRTWQVTVASTGAFGGGSSIAQADPGDGELDVLVLPAGPRVKLPRFALGMRNGTLADQRDVRHERGRCVELVLPPGTPLNVDGELVEARGLNRLEVHGRAFELVTG
jgi:diacylglycerol kinase (ATP)